MQGHQHKQGVKNKVGLGIPEYIVISEVKEKGKS